MSTYRNTCKDCGDTYETESWEPETCPFCELNAVKTQRDKLLAALKEADHELDCSGVDWDSPILRASQLIASVIEEIEATK